MLSDGASVSSVLLRIVVEAARRRGLSDRAFRRALGFSASTFETSRRVPIEIARQVWTQVPLLVDEPELGVLAAEEAGPGVYGFFTMLAECSATWGEAVERLAFIVSLANSAASLDVVHDSSTVAIVLNAPNGVRTGIDVWAASICLLTRARMGDDVSPLAVRYAFEGPRTTDAYRRVFGVPVAFGSPRTELIYARGIYDARVPQAHTELGKLLETFIRRGAEAWAGAIGPAASVVTERTMHAGGSFLSKVRLALQVCIEHGATQLSSVAVVMGVSPRSLQRHLREAGSSLRMLMIEQRAALVRTHEAVRTKAATARLLGYSDRRSFRRAQTRWIR